MTVFLFDQQTWKELLCVYSALPSSPGTVLACSYCHLVWNSLSYTSSENAPNGTLLSKRWLENDWTTESRVLPTLCQVKFMSLQLLPVGWYWIAQVPAWDWHAAQLSGQPGISPCLGMAYAWTTNTPSPFSYLNSIHSNFMQAAIVKQWLYMPLTCQMLANIFLTFSIYPSQEYSGDNNASKKTNASRIYSLSTFIQNNSVKSQLPCGTGDIRRSIGDLA